VWIGAVAISRGGLRWSCGDVVEAGSDDTAHSPATRATVAQRAGQDADKA
jgi:hypothetical protein